MSLDPKNIAVQVALRTQQLEGSSQASLAEAYLTGYTALDGAEVPAYGLIDAVVASEGKLADAIGGDRQNPYRSTLYARSEDLASDVEIPVLSEDDVRFVGVFSQVNDSSDHRPLTECSIQEMERFLEGNYTTRIRKYVLTPSRLYHTRPLAYLEGCAWSRTQAVARLDVDSTNRSPLPTAFEGIWVAETISYLVMEGWLSMEAGYYAQFAQNGLAMIKNRQLDIPSLPTLQSSANPVSN